MAKRKMPKTPTGNLVMPINKRPGHMDTEAYSDSMNGFMRYMYTGHFRKPENRQNDKNSAV